MNKQVLFAAGVSALLAGAPFVSAQAPAQTPSTDPSASAQSSSGPQTVTGCLTPSADGKSFTLTEISPTGSAASSASAPKTWTVVSSGDVDLTKYANHKVEITANKGGGMSDPAASSSSSSAASSAAATSGPRLQVKAVKDISNTCS